MFRIWLPLPIPPSSLTWVTEVSSLAFLQFIPMQDKNDLDKNERSCPFFAQTLRWFPFKFRVEAKTLKRPCKALHDLLLCFSCSLICWLWPSPWITLVQSLWTSCFSLNKAQVFVVRPLHWLISFWNAWLIPTLSDLCSNSTSVRTTLTSVFKIITCPDPNFLSLLYFFP